MKCPVCGTYNKSDYTRCYICGSKLNEVDSKASHAKEEPAPTTSVFEKQNADRATLRQTVADGEPIKEPPKVEHTPQEPSEPTETTGARRKRRRPRQKVDTSTLWQNNKNKRERPFYIRQKDKEAPLLAIDDEESGIFIDETAPTKDRKSNEDKLRRLREGAEVNVVVPPEPPKKKTKQKKKGLRWGRIILSAIVISALLFGIVIGVVYTVKGISSGLSTIFAPRNPLPNNGDPLVERLMSDGQTWHRVTFYGKDGERILVTDPKRTLTIQDGKAELMLDDFSYIPDSTDDNYGDKFVAVNIEAIKVLRNGSEEPISVPEYHISVPDSPLKIIHPIEQSLEEDLSQVLVRLKVTPGSRLIVGDKNLTDLVDSRGFASTYVNLKSGMNDVNIVVETAKHRKTEKQLTIQHPEHAVDFFLDLCPPTHQYNDVKISGLIEKGGQIFINTERTAAAVGYKSENDKYDRFTFQYRLTDFGNNDIKMLAQTPDGREATLIHRVNRTPAEGRYTRMAFKLTPTDYEYLSSNTSNLYGNVYLCSGVITKIIDTDTDTLYLFNTGDDDVLRFVVLKYTGRAELKEGVYYNAYADVIGSHLNYPLLHARFVYVGEKPTTTPTPEPSATPAPQDANENSESGDN